MVSQLHAAIGPTSLPHQPIEFAHYQAQRPEEQQNKHVLAVGKRRAGVGPAEDFAISRKTARILRCSRSQLCSWSFARRNAKKLIRLQINIHVYVYIGFSRSSRTQRGRLPKQPRRIWNEAALLRRGVNGKGPRLKTPPSWRPGLTEQLC